MAAWDRRALARHLPGPRSSCLPRTRAPVPLARVESRRTSRPFTDRPHMMATAQGSSGKRRAQHPINLLPSWSWLRRRLKLIPIFLTSSPVAAFSRQARAESASSRNVIPSCRAPASASICGAGKSILIRVVGGGDDQSTPGSLEQRSGEPYSRRPWWLTMMCPSASAPPRRQPLLLRQRHEAMVPKTMCPPVAESSSAAPG